jgi:hypothetical protein
MFFEKSDAAAEGFQGLEQAVAEQQGAVAKGQAGLLRGHEGTVEVDDHGPSSARRSASPLARHSSHSRSGTESATMPAPT